MNDEQGMTRENPIVLDHPAPILLGLGDKDGVFWSPDTGMYYRLPGQSRIELQTRLDALSNFNCDNMMVMELVIHEVQNLKRKLES